MEKYYLRRKKYNLSSQYNPNFNKNYIFEFPLVTNSYSEDEILDNTYNNDIPKLEHSIQSSFNKNKFKNSSRTKPYLKDKTILIPFNNNNFHNTLKQSNSNNNHIKKIYNNPKEELNLNNKKHNITKTSNNKFAKIKNTKKKKDTNSIKGKLLKYKELKDIMENPGNKIIKGKITNTKNFTESGNSNLFYNKYVKEENKMINYNYFVLNPKNINENKKTENNLIQNIIKYPINKGLGNIINNNNNIYINRVDTKIKNKENKNLYIYLRNSFYKEKENEKDDYYTNSQEFIYNNTLNQNQSINETISDDKKNKENLKLFSRTFFETKDIKTIELKENKENYKILKQNKKNSKSFQKKYLNNSITQNKNISNNNRVKKKELSLKLILDKNNIININNNNKTDKINSITRTSILPQEKDSIKRHSYNTSINNTINTIANKTNINKNLLIPTMQNVKNKSLNQRQKSNKHNKKNKIIIYKKRKISHHKCRSKIKNLNEDDNNLPNYFTENKKENVNKINNYIQLRKNMKKIELFKALTSERKKLLKNDNTIINNKNANISTKKDKNQPSYIYMKSALIKWKTNVKNIPSFSNNKKLISPNSKIVNISSFKKKYYNFILKKPFQKICLIYKRYKFRTPINKLCIFSKNIILKETFSKSNQSNIDEGNNTILELSSSKFSKLNNTNKNMEILEDNEENDNEDFNIEEYEKNNLLNKLNNSNNNLMNSTKGKQIFKIEKGLEKLCRIFFRNLEIKNRENKAELNKEINYESKKLNLNLKKEKSEPNICFKKKTLSGLFSSTSQNWIYIDKKNYKKEDDNYNIELKDKKNKKKQRKKHSLLLNIHKAFSEEKVRDQIQIGRRSVNLNSRFLFSQNQNYDNNNNDNIKNNTNIIIDPKNKINEILNTLTEDNYANILSELFELISNKNNENPININPNINNFEILLNNQFTFVEVIVEKSIKEGKDNNILYAKLCYDLYIKFISDFIYINKKKTKGENLKSILKSECKQKFDECDIITLLNISKINLKQEKNLLKEIEIKLIGIIDFISELINVKMISQKMGLDYLDILKKRINSFDNDIKDYENFDKLKQIKKLYYEGEINLLEKLSKIILERKKPKHIQNLKNFIEDNIITIINDKNNNNELNQDLISKFNDFLQKIKKNDFFKDIKFKNNIQPNENYKDIISLKKEILDYIQFLTENENNKVYQDKNINDDFSWKIIDDLIINKNISLDKIIIYYIQICQEIINDNSQVFKANEYIKNVINYYSYNLGSEKINKIHISIIKIFFDIENFCNSNICMHKIIGLLLFVLLTNNEKLFYIKDLNNYINKDINIKINLSKAIKFTIIAFGKNWKKYFNIFKKNNFFSNSDLFNEYVASPMKLNGFKL